MRLNEIGQGWGGGGLDDRESGFQFDAGGGFRVGEDLLDGLESDGEEFLDFLAAAEGAIVLGVGEGVLKDYGVAAPVVDGVAMDSGFTSGGRQGGSAGERVDDDQLLRGEVASGHEYPFLIPR